MKFLLLILTGSVAGLQLAVAAPDPLPSSAGAGRGALRADNVDFLIDTPLPKAEGRERALLPDEIPLLPQMEEIVAPTERYRMQLAIDAMQPVLPPLDPEITDPQSLAGALTIKVKEFRFAGQTVFTSAQLRARIKRFEGREISAEELEQARVELTKLYLEAGYLNSGAVLPDQDPESGIIRFQVVEGRLTEVDLHGQFWFRPWWLRHQFRRAAGRPVNFNRLKMGLQILRQNPGIGRINAELKPGGAPGESILHVIVEERQPFRLGLLVSNGRPPSVGEGLGEVYFADLNVTGHNDPFELHWNAVHWEKDGGLDYAGGDNIQASYQIPVSPWDTRLTIYGNKNDASVIDETFAALGITSRAKSFGARLTQGLYETLSNSISASVCLDREQSQTYLLRRPFTLSVGAIDGKSDVVATRLSLEWVNRSQFHVLALRSVFSFGLYAFDSTHADPRDQGSNSIGPDPNGFEPEIPDSKFFAWLGQAQFVYRLFDTATLRQLPEASPWNRVRESLLVLRANAQLADDALLSLEQFSLGGMQNVRGYRENQLLRDNGVFFSAELRIPLLLGKDKSPLVSLAPFFDFGAGWDTRKVEDNYQTIYSAGVGLLFNLSKNAQATIYWGHPFVELSAQKQSLQDYGVHFALSITAF